MHFFPIDGLYIFNVEVFGKGFILLQLKVKIFISALYISPSLLQFFLNLVDLGPQTYSCLFYMAIHLDFLELQHLM